MSHTVREKSKLLARVRRIRGQVDAIERALEFGGRLRRRAANHRLSARCCERADG